MWIFGKDLQQAAGHIERRHQLEALQLQILKGQIELLHKERGTDLVEKKQHYLDECVIQGGCTGISGNGWFATSERYV
jgi:hypothetical protein